MLVLTDVAVQNIKYDVYNMKYENGPKCICKKKTYP